MGKTSNLSKQHWNDAHYRQIKIYSDKQTANLFKSVCVQSGVSMSETIEDFMRSFADVNASEKQLAGQLTSRGKRRATVQKIIGTLANIKDAEELYMERIPENLQGGIFYSNAEESIEALDEAIALLEQAY